MKPSLLLAAFLLAPASPARAQNFPDQQESSGEERGGKGPEGGDKEEAAAPMTLADAQANFQTVIENFINERSTNGHWTLKEKTSKNVLKLKLLSVDVKSIRQLQPGHFSGRAELFDAESSAPRGAEFKVDLSAERWKVTGMTLLPAPKKPKSAAPRRPSKTP